MAQRFCQMKREYQELFQDCFRKQVRAANLTQGVWIIYSIATLAGQCHLWEAYRRYLPPRSEFALPAGMKIISWTRNILFLCPLKLVPCAAAYAACILSPSLVWDGFWQSPSSFSSESSFQSEAKEIYMK